MPVYLQKNGSYRIQFDFNGHTYSKRLDNTYTKTQAEKLEIKWKHDLMFESFGVEKKKDIIIEDFLTEHFLPFAEGHYSAEGFKTNVVVICKSFLPFVRGLSLRKISVADVERFQIHRSNLLTKHETKRKPATVQREMNIISKIFSQAIKNDYLETNPCSKINRPVVSNLQDSILPVDILESFLDNIYSDWARDVTLLILNTGLRQKDALGLRKFNVNFEKREIRLIQSKNGREIIIWMNDSVFELLSSRRSNGSELFFPSPKTGKQGTSIKGALKGAAGRMELGKVGTRVLRRTVTSILEDERFSTTTMSKFLGHSNERTVHRYARSKDVLREAAEALNISKPAKILPTTLKVVKK